MGPMSTAETRDVPAGARPPLADRTVVVTRPEAQATELVDALEGFGARVLRFPTIRIVPPNDPRALRRAARADGEYDWVVFTSSNGVLSFHEATDEAGRALRDAVGGASVCCVGPATAGAAEALGLAVSLIPETHMAEGVLEALSAAGSLQGRRVLLPVADGARDVLPRGLRARGAVVDVITAYRTSPVDEAEVEQLARLREGVDLVTFTSPSSVRAFAGLVPGPPIAPAGVIGPVTASTARELGYDVTVQAERYTVAGLVEAVARHYSDEAS